MRTAGRLAAVAATAAALLAVPATAHAATPVAMTGTAHGVSVPAGRVAGTPCDPRAWEAPGTVACRVRTAGVWSATTDTLGEVRGYYTGDLTVTTAGHAPGCLETHGRLDFTAYAADGRRLGRIGAPLDGGDSETCRREAGVRTFFLRADVSGGTGVFAGASGNWLLTGSGRLLSDRRAVTADRLDVAGDLR